MTINSGSLIRFAVEGNPSTGYEWDTTKVDDDGAFDVCGDYVQKSDGMPGDGSVGTYYFTISAGKMAGDGTFSIAYDRSWDDEAAL